MSIVSVDNISPIGSGTSVTVNSAATLVLNNANSTGVITATSFVGNLIGSSSSVGVVPCFSARATNGGVTPFTTDGRNSPYTPVPFDAVDVNRGSCYSGTDKKFTCTVAGVYRFNVSLCSGGTNHWFRGWIYHQSGGSGTPTAIHKSQSDYQNNSSTDFAHVGFSCLYPCAVGDKVWLINDTSQGGGTSSVYCGENGYWSVVSGQLISA